MGCSWTWRLTRAIDWWATLDECEEGEEEEEMGGWATAHCWVWFGMSSHRHGKLYVLPKEAI